MTKPPKKGTMCAYGCERDADTWDHIIPRSFFLERHRPDNRKVPACRPCNNEKSKLERELSIVLPFGATYTHSKEILFEAIAKAERSNKRLANSIASGVSEKFVWQNAFNLKSQMALRLENNDLERLSVFVAQGLHYLETGQISHVPSENSFTCLPEINENEMLGIINSANGTEFEFKRVNGNWGTNTFVYNGYLWPDDKRKSIWLLEFFGGIKTAGKGKSFTPRVWVWLGHDVS